MTSSEFWEEEPQLYWSYRIFYMQKQERDMEQADYVSWLEGMYNNIAVSVSLGNAFGKQKAKYVDKPATMQQKKKEEHKELNNKLKGVKDKDIRQQIEYNYWARL